jgi:hypothetical protein
MPLAIGEKCEIRVYTESSKKDGTRSATVKDGLDEDDFDSDVSYALIAKKVFDDKGSLSSTTLAVNSPQLISLFKEMIGSYPTVPSDFEDPFEMSSPFRMLFHYWDDLHQAREETKDDELRMHLSLLLQYMKMEMGSDKERIDRMMKKQSITFRQLWTVFRPGDIVYTEVEKQSWLLKVEKTAYEESKAKGKFMEVHCRYTDYDGKDVGSARHIVNIYQKKNFAAENPSAITDLPIFPRKYLENYDKIADRLESRGAKFLSMQGVIVRKYNGLAVYLNEPPVDFYHPEMADWPGVWIPYTVSRPCMLIDLIQRTVLTA